MSFSKNHLTLNQALCRKVKESSLFSNESIAEQPIGGYLIGSGRKRNYGS
jgi:hypothetical protein